MPLSSRRTTPPAPYWPTTTASYSCWSRSSAPRAANRPAQPDRFACRGITPRELLPHCYLDAYSNTLEPAPGAGS